MNIAPFSHPLYLMLKPVGARCNLRCTYCYYLEKKALYASQPQHEMSLDVLEKITAQYLDAQTQTAAVFTWHGGEPLLRGLDFYRRAVELQRRYAGRIYIDNCLQTNGTLLTDEWCNFFRANRFLIGLSLDGPEALHDRYRRTANLQPTFARVMRAAELLTKHGVEFNMMGVVNNVNADHPLELYRFFKSTGCRYLQLAPIVEQVDGRPAPWNVPAEKWGAFLTAIFDEWVRHDVGQMFVQQFDAALASWVGESPGCCIFAPTCGHAGVAEFNGDVYSCDHFVFPDNYLGNIHAQTLTAMMYSPQQQAFGASKQSTLPAQCRRCRYLFACNGECPKNRICTTSDGEAGLNYLCQGYYQFFAHAAPYLDFMANELRHERAPENVMRYAQ